MKNELNERLFNFATRCLKFLRFLPTTSEYKIIKYQLAKSSTSAGANYENPKPVLRKLILLIKLELH